MGNKTLISRSSPMTMIISDEESVANIAGSIMITHIDRVIQLRVNAITKGTKNPSAAIKLSSESNASK